MTCLVQKDAKHSKLVGTCQLYVLQETSRSFVRVYRPARAGGRGEPFYFLLLITIFTISSQTFRQSSPQSRFLCFATGTKNHEEHGQWTVVRKLSRRVPMSAATFCDLLPSPRDGQCSKGHDIKKYKKSRNNGRRTDSTKFSQNQSRRARKFQQHEWQ